MKIISPHDVFHAECPLITYSDHTSGLIEWFIKMRHGSTVNHVMWLVEPGKFASQGNTYSIADSARYMRKGNRLLFIEIVGLTPVQKRIIQKSIEEKLMLPWYKKAYDWVGIFGQAIGVSAVNIKGLNYCSEDVAVHLKKIAPYVDDELANIINGMNDHFHPDAQKEYLLSHPKYFRIYGIWNSDVAKNN